MSIRRPLFERPARPRLIRRWNSRRRATCMSLGRGTPYVRPPFREASMLDHRAELTRRHLLQGAGAATAAAFLSADGASAQARSETLLVVQELGPNSLDMQGVGSNQTVNGLSWNCYDRLMTYGSKTLADGSLSYDRMALAPELAESWEG